MYEEDSIEDHPQTILEQLNGLLSAEGSKAERVKAARKLWDRLRLVCLDKVEYRSYFEEGRKSFASLRAKRHEEEVDPAEIERNVALRERVLKIVGEAAAKEDPVHYVPHVQKCVRIWRDLEPVGSRGRELTRAYRKESKKFWTRIKELKQAEIAASVSAKPLSISKRILGWRRQRQPGSA